MTLNLNEMIAKIHTTPLGNIHYWISGSIKLELPTLVLLPGLTADHRLFDKQVEAFEGHFNLFVWDAPGHGASRPFDLSFDMKQKTVWLNEILKAESICKAIFIGQSMGGYVSQMYAELFPERIAGFISIDSAPLQRKYLTKTEIWMLKHCGPMYRMFPWKLLVETGSNGVATSQYGQDLMREMMLSYDKESYVRLAGHGYRMLAEAVELNLPYKLPCPVLLICGTKDNTGSSKRYNKAWSKTEGYRLEWIDGAGHNSNTDRPEQINKLIEDFVSLATKVHNSDL